MSSSRTIKAIGIQSHGELDVIEELQRPAPTPRDDQVLIKVEYAGVNFIDTYERAGVYPAAAFPKVLGKEAAGTIVSLPTSQAVTQDKEYQLRGLSVGDRVVTIDDGFFAEEIAVPWQKVVKLPDSVSTKIAAASALQGLTALTFATESYNIKKGDIILIYSAAGGLGINLTQIAVHRGATVIGTVSSEAKAEVARGNGAKHVIITTQQNVVDEVLKITNGEGVHAVFDGVGKDTFEDNFKIIRRKGTFVTLGNASGIPPLFQPLRLGERNIKLIRPRLFGYIVTPEEIRTYQTQYNELIASGAVKPVIHKEYPFTAEGVKQSQTDLTSRGTIGKLILKVA
ncbi:hypothetical protein FRC04_003824 [Tulasnella sp. 424]|nr:hypothetical protein FRC04_003824 [Tulasnella sp. 424]KAG8966120.1 hypothetical protein FRC05_002879 [Tulasnella sp. 425]